VADARVKFQAVSSTLITVLKCSSAEVHAEFVRRLSSPLREAVARPPAANTWVPIAWLEEALGLAFEVAYDSSLARMREHGRRAITIDMSGPYKLFIRALSPTYVIARTPFIWGQYYQHNGTMTVSRFDTTLREVDICFDGIVIPSVAFWQNQIGTVEGTMQLTRLRNPQVTVIAGGGENDRVCVMRAIYD
jgi:hypothetical protein